MSEWKARRFWTATSVVEEGDEYAVRLDDRPLRTPFKSPLVVPTRAMAELIASEWDAQEEVIAPLSMPATRAANSAIDKVAPQKDGVVDMLAAYGESDLLCYRAEGPEELVQRQSRAWDPWLTWSANALDAPLLVATGVMPVTQPPDSLRRLHRRVAAMDAFALTGFHDLVTLSGSLILAFAVAEERLDVSDAWGLSRLDEEWQIEQWGPDEEAEKLTASRRAAFHDAERFFRLSA